MTRPATAATLAAAVVMLCSQSGCQDPGAGKKPVSGQVRWKGEPLPAGVILFGPADRAVQCSAGGDIANGTYAIPAEGGLLPGKYVVRISAPVKKNPNAKPGPDGSFEMTDLLPTRYHLETELTAEVDAGRPAVFDFDLKSR